MKSTTEVTREIRQFVQDKIKSGVVVQVDWVTTEILAQKCDIEGEDSDFYRSCAIDFIKKTVKSVIGKYEPQPVQDEQLIMEGFEHLQKAYTMQRNGQTVLVPTHLLSDVELEAREQEYHAMAHGCIAHANEIRTYRAMREVA